MQFDFTRVVKGCMLWQVRDALKAVERRHEEWTASALAAELGLAEEAAERLSATLIAEGFVKPGREANTYHSTALGGTLMLSRLKRFPRA